MLRGREHNRGAAAARPQRAREGAKSMAAGRTASRSRTPRQGKKRSTRSAKNPAQRSSPATAETLAAKQREISVSEFFAKNRHLLGFDNPRKALLTTVKEAVDNALDACEEAGILPDILVRIEHLAEVGETRYRVTVEDNGPGVVRRQIDNIFGKLLYGSKFHRLKMSRGQQGIGISAAGMYGLMTTGKPMVIVTRSRKGRPAHHVELAMDTTRNRPEVTVDVETEDFPAHTGTRVVIELEGRYTRGKTSVDAYIEQTAIANPHARILYYPPTAASSNEADAPKPGDDGELDLFSQEQGREREKERKQASVTTPIELPQTTSRLPDGGLLFPRAVEELPPEPREIKPHPRGVELGALIRMLKDTDHTKLGGFLQNEFCRISPRLARAVCEQAGLTPNTWVKSVGHAQAEALHKALQATKFQSPPLDCLTPIGARQLLAGLLKGVRAEFFTATTRPPSVYRGNPFQIEVGLAFGGALPAEAPAQVIRFANRTPLLYQQSACAMHKAVVETSWRSYGLSQPKGALPVGPLVVMVHMASVWVPFTSESKEAVADYDEIRKEMRLALQECGRKLGAYLRRRDRVRRERDRRMIFERYIGEVAQALATIDPRLDAAAIKADLEAAAKARTEIADLELDEDGLPVRAPRNGAAPLDENTVVLEEAAATTEERSDEPAKPTRRSDASPPRRRRNGDAAPKSTRKKRSRSPGASGKKR